MTPRGERDQKRTNVPHQVTLIPPQYKKRKREQKDREVGTV